MKILSADKSAYSALMAASQQAVSAQILGAYDFGKHQQHSGCGGRFRCILTAVGARYPQLELNLFDLPGVVPLANSRWTIIPDMAATFATILCRRAWM